MKIPTATLPHTVTITPYLGDGAEGPMYGTAVTARARVVGRRRQVTTANGTNIVAPATVTLRPGVSVPAESKITHDGQTYTVLEVSTAMQLGSDYCTRLICDGSRGANP